MFVLPFYIPESPRKLKLKDPVFSIGSCFADNMGKKLTEYKFDVVANPLGILYNPYSIFKNLRLLLTEGLDPENFIKRGDVYYHWDTHSTISGTHLRSFRQLLERRSLEARQSLIQSRWMIITFGTTYVYKYLENDKIVANCHKIPQTKFERIALSSTEIIEDYFETMEVIHAANPDMKVILTVSPVRHIRDGLIQNNISKATLIQAVSQISEKDETAFYFPAYELMIDVLRDYRFYKEDLIHPSEQAIQYIWDQFVQTFMDESAQKFIKSWTAIRQSLAHRSFHPTSKDHQAFLKSTINRLMDFESKIDISTELASLQKQLTK